MRKYEIMFIVRPDLEETEIKTVAENMKEVLSSKGANVVDFKEMGQRDLAYEIKKHKKGYYFLIQGLLIIFLLKKLYSYFLLLFNV